MPAGARHRGGQPNGLGLGVGCGRWAFFPPLGEGFKGGTWESGGPADGCWHGATAGTDDRLGAEDFGELREAHPELGTRTRGVRDQEGQVERAALLGRILVGRLDF